jgi:hypothetical protein
MSFINTIFNIIEEQNIIKTSKTKPIVDAIKNRNKISFFYTGPRKPAKDSVKPGKRIDAEAVALGLSKRGNLVVRAYVQPPSVSKKGFDKTGWRTFMVSRMSDLRVSDETFNQKRPDYKEGDDRSMSVTYVTTDWTNKPEVKKPRIVKPKPIVPSATATAEPTPSVEPTTTTTPEEPKTTELPQPKTQTKPEKLVTPPKQEPKPSKPTTTPEEPKTTELPQPKQTEKPVANPEEDEENKNLQESIKNIKRLMFS